MIAEKKFNKDQIDFKVQQANEKYLFKLKQEEDKIIFDLKEAIAKSQDKLRKTYGEDYNTYCVENAYSKKQNLLQEEINGSFGIGCYGDGVSEQVRRLLDYYMNHVNPMYFSFGKYKDRIVQDILQKDKEYCIWLSRNVIGKDFNTLKILDYLHKTLIGTKYIDKSKESTYYMILKLYVPKEWHIWLDKNDILQIKTYSSSSSSSSYSNNNSYSSHNFYNGQENSAFWNSMIDVEDIVDYGDLC